MNRHVAIKPADAEQDFSVENFHRMMALGAFEDMRVELVRGKLEKMSPSSVDHARINFQVGLKLAMACPQWAKRILVDAAVEIDSGSIRSPDVVVLKEDLSDRFSVRGEEVELVVEVAVSTLSRDLGDKTTDYARSGVPLYWVIDVQAGIVHVFGSADGVEYRDRSVFRFGESLLLPDGRTTIVID